MRDQPIAGAAPGLVHVQAQAMDEGLFGTHGVQPCQKAPQPAQHVRVFEFGGAATTAGGDRHAVPAEGAEGGGRAEQLRAFGMGVRQGERGHGGHLGVGQGLREGVLLQNLRVAPAARSVELGHHKPAVVHPNLENAVFVGVQLQHPTVHRLPEGFEGVEDEVRCEVGVRGVGGVHAAS